MSSCDAQTVSSFVRQRQQQQPRWARFEASAGSRCSYHPSQHHTLRELTLVKVSQPSSVGWRMPEGSIRHPATIQSLALLISNLQRWQRWRSAPLWPADMAKPRPLVAVVYPHLRALSYENHDSPNLHHPLALHAATLTIWRDLFAQSLTKASRTGQLARSFGTFHTI